MKADKAVGSLLTMLCFASVGCDNAAIPECERNLHHQSVSPDGMMKAAVLDVQCGATTPDATWVLLATSKEELDGNRHKVAVFEGKIASIEWRGNELHVSYGTARPFAMNQRGNGTRITYEGQAP